MTKEYVVDLAFEVGDLEDWNVNNNKINDAAEASGIEYSLDSGTGFGLRDMQFRCKTNDDAVMLCDTLALLQVDYDYIGVYEDEEVH